MAAPASPSRLPASAGLTIGAVLVGWAMLWLKLSVDWSVNDQYQYGWFVPPLALALFGLRWRDRPAPAGIGGAPAFVALSAIGLLLLLPIRLVEEPNGDWRMLFWMHAATLTFLSLALAAWQGGWPWVRHFAFPTLFLLLAVPWPSGPEQALVQTLMRSVAAISAEALNLLGIPAIPQGNLIRVRDQLVGVNEACSGIRSLQTVLMGALMLGELSRFSWTRRALLLIGGVAVAMCANVFRSALLVWIAAHSGADALKHYHDAAGMTVLFIVFGGLLGIGKLLDRGALPAVPPVKASPTPPPMVPSGRALSTFAAAAVFGWIVFTEVGTSVWYRAHERGRQRLPSWTVATPPAGANDFQVVPVDDVTRALLRYDTAQSVRWRRPGAACSMYFFRWEPGRTSATLATMHQPTVCLPASGLTQVGDTEKRRIATPIGIDLPVEQYEFMHNRQRLYVFYVVWQDRSGYELPSAAVTRNERVEAAWLGQRNLGQQTLEMIITGPATAEAAAEAFSQELASVIRRKG